MKFYRLNQISADDTNTVYGKIRTLEGKPPNHNQQKLHRVELKSGSWILQKMFPLNHKSDITFEILEISQKKQTKKIK